MAKIAYVWTGSAWVEVGSGVISGGSGMSNPMTTAGDLIIGGSSGTPARLAGDTTNANHFLRSLSAGGVAAAPTWEALTATDIPTIAQSQVTSLVTDLSAKMTNPMTTIGDIIYGAASGAPTRIPAGSAGQALISAGGAAPAWGTLTLENLPGAWAKKSCRAATTANIATLAGGAPNTLDGVTLAANDRILVKDQSTGGQNGIYTVQTLGTGANGTWVRSADADTVGEICSALVVIDEGTLYGGVAFDNDTKATDTLGTTAMVWNRVADAGYAHYLGTTSMLLGRASAAQPIADISVTLSTGANNLAPLKFVAGPVLTNAVQGVMEFDGDAFYGTPDSAAVGGRGVLQTSHFYALSANRALSNATGAQSIFGVGLTVAGSTTYEVEMEVTISCSGTTTNVKSLTLGGTATYTSAGYSLQWVHTATNVQTAGTFSQFWAPAATIQALGATSTTNYTRIRICGLVRINASGTFIPQISYGANPGAAPSVQANSFIKMTPVGTNTVTAVGAWA